ARKAREKQGEGGCARRFLKHPLCWPAFQRVRPISAIVRYSRVRTEEFTVVGADRAAGRFPTEFCPRFEPTGELSVLSPLVSIGVVGIHGQAWPDVSRPVSASAGSQLPEPAARGSPRGHRCR